MTAFRVGDRVTVRRKLGDGRAADVIGWVEMADAETITIERPGLPTTVIQRDAVLAVRILPMARGGRSPMRELPGVVLSALRGDKSLKMGEWFTDPAEPTKWYAVGDPGCAVADALAHVARSRIRASVATVSGSLTEADIQREGWVQSPALAMVMFVQRLNDYLSLPRAKAETLTAAQWDSTVAGDWLVVTSPAEPSAADPSGILSELAAVSRSAARLGARNVAVAVPAHAEAASAVLLRAGFMTHHRLVRFVQPQPPQRLSSAA